MSGTVTVDTELGTAVAASDTMSNPTAPQVLAHEMVWDGISSLWRRRNYSTTSTGDSIGNSLYVPVISGSEVFQRILSYVWDQANSTWSRIRSIVNGLNTSGSGVVAAGLVAQLDDSSPSSVTENQFGPVRMSSRRALLTETIARSPWRINSNPGVNSQATATTPGVAGAKNVLRHILVVMTSGATAPTAGVVTVVVRDGASGTGTIIWQHALGILATAGASQGYSAEVYIEGSVGNAMTVEFITSGGANTYESISADGEVVVY